jgi:hypothetical protein
MGIDSMQAANIGTIDRGMRDGVAVHTAALAAGLTTRLLSRQVLQIYAPEGETTAFTHGVPQGSTLAAVTYSQDLRMRRGLLGHAGIPQPRGATFSVGRGRDSALRYAREIGYPVVIKPALGDSTIDVKRGIHSAGNLNAAFDEFLTPVRHRPGHTEAAYGITELRKPGWRKGKETVPPGYSLLIEKELAGRYLRILVIDGHIASVVQCPNGPWGPNNTPMEDLGELKETVTDLVTAVGAELPGLRVLSVDVVVAPDSQLKEGSPPALVVEVSERPWLEVQHRIDPNLCRALAERILVTELPGRHFGASRDHIEAAAEFSGVIDPSAFVRTVISYAELLGVAAELSVTDTALGHVGGTLRGRPDRVAEIVEIVLDDGIDSQVAMKARLELQDQRRVPPMSR